MKKTKVYLRETKEYKDVFITDDNKPKIPLEMIDNWQMIINITADILKVPSALIMQILSNRINVFLASETPDNPYTIGDSEKLEKGLYCETVIGENRELLVENALNDKHWCNNPDIKLGMISYYGLPLQWPDGETFGTICVLDYQSNEYNEKYKQLLKAFKRSIEKDLNYLTMTLKLKKLVNIDMLTGIYNRRKCTKILKEEFDRSQRTNLAFSIALIDLDQFKQINDKFGHHVGDEVLKEFSDLFSKNIRKIDNFCRWGGDEFLLICPGTKKSGIEQLIHKIQQHLEKINHAQFLFEIKFTYGSAFYKSDDNNYDDILLRADQNLYQKKIINCLNR